MPTGDDDGEYRKASSQVHGSAVKGSGASAGGTAPRDALRAVYEALKSGAASPRDANSYYDHLVSGGAMTMPGSSAPQYMRGLGRNNQLTITQSAYDALALQAQAQLHYQQMMALAGMPVNAMGGSGRPHDPTTLKSEGVRAGEIIAWRAWNIDGDTLASVTANKKWQPDETMSGDAAGGYGIHAYKAPHGPLLDQYVSRGSTILWVIGEVALWGDIIEHEDGYRSEFARVHSLVTWHERVPRSARLAIETRYLTRADFKIEDAA